MISIIANKTVISLAERKTINSTKPHKNLLFIERDRSQRDKEFNQKCFPKNLLTSKTWSPQNRGETLDSFSVKEAKEIEYTTLTDILLLKNLEETTLISLK